jgi:polyribonucleotide nucleotidyltransferase
MDAGIPLKRHVAGISVGLVSEVDQSTGIIKDYRILTDILGLEDHLGDMDFKISGTRNGVTAIQLDIKPAGVPLDIICECLEPALKGRLQILDHMERVINAPRTQDHRNSPRIVTLKYCNESIRRLIGPLGALKRKIEEETGVRISVSDGTITIVAKNQIAMEKVLEKIDFIVGREIEIGGIYKGIVTSIKEYGAFVEFNGGQQGLLHISEMSHEPVSKVSDIVSVGQKVTLKCIEQDNRGNIKLSLKATILPPNISVESYVASNSREKIQPLVEDTPVRVSKSSGSTSSSSSSSSPSAFVIRSVEESEVEEKSAGINVTATKEMKNKVKGPVSAKTLKLGMRTTAKVYQIRARGLVLDLGSGIRGMYRFEGGESGEFEVGDEVEVRCTSFSTKGVPVMSRVDVIDD